MKARPAVVFYTRANCHLCDVAKGILERIARRVPFDLSTVDIDADPELALRFGEEVPVIFVNGRKAFKYRVDPGLFEKRLQEE